MLVIGTLLSCALRAAMWISGSVGQAAALLLMGEVAGGPGGLIALAGRQKELWSRGRYGHIYTSAFAPGHALLIDLSCSPCLACAVTPFVDSMTVANCDAVRAHACKPTMHPYHSLIVYPCVHHMRILITLNNR